MERTNMRYGDNGSSKRKPDINLSIFPSLSLAISFSLHTYIYIHCGTWKAGAWRLYYVYIYIHIYLFVSHQFVRRLDTVVYYYSDILGSPSRESSTISPPRPSGPRPSFPRRFACYVFCVRRFFTWFPVFSDSSLFQSINLSIVCNYQRHLTGDIPWVSTRYAATLNV